MSWYPLWNSLRIAAISSVLVFFLGILCAYYVARLPRAVKGILDVFLTLPMVLPPTVCGYFLLLAFGVKRPLGMFLAQFGIKFVMTWYGGILAATVVAFPLMYRTARGAFESFDMNLAYAGQTLGLSNTFIFWKSPYARLPSGHPGGDCAGLCPGTGGVRRHKHAHWLYAGENSHHFHHGLSAVAHQ